MPNNAWMLRRKDTMIKLEDDSNSRTQIVHSLFFYKEVFFLLSKATRFNDSFLISGFTIPTSSPEEIDELNQA